MKTMELTRICPVCNKILQYKLKSHLTRANLVKSTCKACARHRQIITDETKLKWSISRTGRSVSAETREKLRKANKGKVISDHQKQQISIANSGRKHSDEYRRKCRDRSLGRILSEETKQKLSKVITGIKRSSETKQKLRINRIRSIEQRVGQIVPSYNPTACKLFNEINATLGWNGQHAENGGEYRITELGYWVDYYEPELNLVIEYDELRHHGIRYINKDVRRQQEIEHFLGCKFVRIKENTPIDEILSILKEVA